MSRRRIPFGKGVALTAAFLLLAAPALASDRYHSQSTPPTRPSAAPVYVVRPTAQPVSIAIAVAPSVQPAKEPLSVRLRGPDGEVRRFPVEGGLSAIQFTRPVILHAGQSVTIRWVAAK